MRRSRDPELEIPPGAMTLSMRENAYTPPALAHASVRQAPALVRTAVLDVERALLVAQ